MQQESTLCGKAIDLQCRILDPWKVLITTSEVWSDLQQSCRKSHSLQVCRAVFFVKIHFWRRFLVILYLLLKAGLFYLFWWKVHQIWEISSTSPLFRDRKCPSPWKVIFPIWMHKTFRYLTKQKAQSGVNEMKPMCSYTP